jgi:integrase/recombinase XerD
VLLALFFLFFCFTFRTAKCQYWEKDKWQQGGRTASIYTHISGKQVDDQILAVFGKKKIDLQSNRAVDVIYCPRCSLESTPASIQCSKCGFPLSDEAAKNLYERRQKADELMNLVASHPEFVNLLKKVIVGTNNVDYR